MPMRRLLRTTALLLPVALLSACPLSPSREVILPIDSVTVPAEIAPGTQLHLVATVTSGGCRSYERLEVVRSASRVTLIAHGLDSSGPSQVCTQELRYTQVPVDVPPPFTDPLIVAAFQPTSEPSEWTVRVR